MTENIQEKANRMAVLKNKQAGMFGQTCATITMDELFAMQKEVAAIQVPDSITTFFVNCAESVCQFLTENT